MNNKPQIKITIEQPNAEPKVIVADGIAFATVTEQEDTHNMRVALIGKLNIPELKALYDTVNNELKQRCQEALDQCISQASEGMSVKDLINALFGGQS
jgi:hypothetical protein